MIHADGDDAAEGIEISTARFIIDVLHGAFHKHQRILVVVAHMRRQERASLSRHFDQEGPAIRSGSVVEERQGKIGGHDRLSGLSRRSLISITGRYVQDINHLAH
jgi:hypothetical protein